MGKAPEDMIDFRKWDASEDGEGQWGASFIEELIPLQLARNEGYSLKADRVARGQTQAEATAELGVTEKTWRTWEKNGPSRMGKLLLEKVGWA